MPIHLLQTARARQSFRLFITTFKSILAAHLFVQYGFATALTLGPSMLPTLSAYGDSVLVSRYYRRGRGIKVGDVVTFDSVDEPGTKVIKRVLGLEGDYVMMGSPREDMSDKMLQVPKGHCWVVGDNLLWSKDSRHFGPMPLALIKGKVIAKLFPWGEREWTKNRLTYINEQ